MAITCPAGRVRVTTSKGAVYGSPRAPYGMGPEGSSLRPALRARHHRPRASTHTQALFQGSSAQRGATRRRCTPVVHGTCLPQHRLLPSPATPEPRVGLFTLRQHLRPCQGEGSSRRRRSMGLDTRDGTPHTRSCRRGQMKTISTRSCSPGDSSTSRGAQPGACACASAAMSRSIMGSRWLAPASTMCGRRG